MLIKFHRELIYLSNYRYSIFPSNSTVTPKATPFFFTASFGDALVLLVCPPGFHKQALSEAVQLRSYNRVTIAPSWSCFAQETGMQIADVCRLISDHTIERISFLIMYKHEHNNATIYVVNTSDITYCFTYLLHREFKFSDATPFFFFLQMICFPR